MTINRAAHIDGLKPMIKRWSGLYRRPEMECDQIFERVESQDAYEDDRKLIGFGLAPIKNESAPIQYDDTRQGTRYRYDHLAYALGFTISREALADNRYMPLAERLTRHLMHSMEQTVETVTADVLNNGFTVNTHDGVPLLSTDHPSRSAGLQSNELAVGSSLTEAAVEDLLVDIYNAEDERGLKINLNARRLVVPPSIYFDATRITQATQQSGTANNDPNAMRVLGMFDQDPFRYRYLTSDTSWFITTDAPQGLTRMVREDIEAPEPDNDFDTHNARFSSYVRFSAGATDWLGVFGSAPA